MTYKVKTDAFEGPLEFLLNLIEKNKLSINQVSLASITDQYIAEVKRCAIFAAQDVSQFLVVASTLMLIKSRSLLPHLTLSAQEETDVRDLEKRLELLRLIRQAAAAVQEFYESPRRMFSREAASTFPVLFYPPDGLSPDHLQTIVRQIVAALPHNLRTARLPAHAIKKIISLEEKISELMARVEHNLKKSFRSLVKNAREKTEIIVSFLALLELMKQGRMAGDQDILFGDITIRRS